MGGKTVTMNLMPGLNNLVSTIVFGLIAVIAHTAEA